MRNFLSSRNVKKWEKFGHIVIRFEENILGAQRQAFVKPTAAAPF
jgi:hypothetical protein